MKPPEYRRSIRRMYWTMAAAGVAGAAIAWARWDWRTAAGFATGAAGSIGMFWWFHNIAEALSRRADPPNRPRLMVLGVLRYGLIAATAYVMMEFLGIEPISVVTGLLVMAVAVLAEILFLLFSPRKNART
ncbi:MAG: hypothetical protein FJW39_27555 [Acidobacteria bacterium]|nr:hypothetical protein [Acidobacteriota bacterium]